MKGLVFIPDITGFTTFVSKVDIDSGVSITRDLLNEIIDNNHSGLTLSEIEGDALLFYKLGDPLPIRVILSLFKRMSLAFRKKFQQLRLKYNVNASLSLKFILHYGDIQVYCLKGFEKLYGVTIVESHCLLKNGFTGSDYLLITEDYIQAIDKKEDSKNIITCDISKRTSQSFSNLREINYYFFDRFPKTAGHYDAASEVNVG